MNNMDKQDFRRMETLAAISGIEVSMYRKNGVQYYQFFSDGNTVKTVCTYRKAKVLAEGIRIGTDISFEATLT